MVGDWGWGECCQQVPVSEPSELVMSDLSALSNRYLEVSPVNWSGHPDLSDLSDVSWLEMSDVSGNGLVSLERSLEQPQCH